MSKDLRLWEKGRGLIHHHLESLTSGEGGGNRRVTILESSSRVDRRRKLEGREWWWGGLSNVTSTLASSRLHFSSRLCYEANYAWPQISSSEKLAKLNVANVRKIDLSPLSLYVSFVIFQRVAISTDFSFSQNPKWKRRDKKRENNFFFLFFIFDRDIRYSFFIGRNGRSSLETFRPVRISREGGGGNFENFDLKKISIISSRNLFYIYFIRFG